MSEARSGARHSAAGSGHDLEDSMAGFRRKPGGISARFTAAQAGIVRNLVAQVAELIGEPGGPPGLGEVSEDTLPGWPGEPGPGGTSQPGQAPFGMEDLAGLGGPVTPPQDPVLARLFPDAYRDDPAAAGEFRRYTEQDLRSGKLAAARTVLATLPDSGGRVKLSDPDAQAWLRTLNDVRLALGVRLGITDDYQDLLAGLSDGDPRLAYVHVYDWLTFLQETLVRSLW